MTRTISGYAAKSIEELPTLWDGFAKLVRAGLGPAAIGAACLLLVLARRRAAAAIIATEGSAVHAHIQG